MHVEKSGWVKGDISSLQQSSAHVVPHLNRIDEKKLKFEVTNGKKNKIDF